jgi:rhamnogalacturonyl hydrolase YesR
VAGLSPEGWCRAIGWFGMAAVQVLDVIDKAVEVGYVPANY